MGPEDEEVDTEEGEVEIARPYFDPDAWYERMREEEMLFPGDTLTA